MLRHIDINFKNFIKYTSRLAPFTFNNNVVLNRNKNSHLGNTRRVIINKDLREVKKKQLVKKK